MEPTPQAIDAARLAPGLADPVHGAQPVFRAVLDAMARPGRIVAVPKDVLAAPPPAPLGRAAASVLLTLCDIDTPLWLDTRTHAGAADYLRFHCGAPLVADPSAARFAVAAEASDLPPLDAFDLGSDEYPDRSATLVVEVSALAAATGRLGGTTLTLSGPGIAGTAELTVIGLPGGFWAQRAALAPLFPRGLDVVLTCGDHLAALLRTTWAEEV
jgi:alpha-D-ribose 1-methylphosphonate 5-triphosphate synthase subunit PhnH